jgi:hypothetical protein
VRSVEAHGHGGHGPEECVAGALGEDASQHLERCRSRRRGSRPGRSPRGLPRGC